MPLLDINLQDVPDSVPTVPPGMYTTEIQDATVEQNSKGDGQNLVINHKVVGPSGDNVGRELKQWISLKPYKNDSTGKQHLIGLVRVLKSAGVDPATLTNGAGFNTDDLKGKTTRVKVASRTVTKDGQQKEYTGIEEVLIPGDQGYAV